eukprot:TRINITY_DN17326_c0_g1_i3.p1 TRINITY_DN17326_c0_g1~~TRINITY_DN17326_c0_g1_i3.p1  ORF type:complete len:347 (-),score=91.37 TRINITY_DN17326_c0_g1_i3:999-2039(-)
MSQAENAEPGTREADRQEADQVNEDKLKAIQEENALREKTYMEQGLTEEEARDKVQQERKAEVQAEIDAGANDPSQKEADRQRLEESAKERAERNARRQEEKAARHKEKEDRLWFRQQKAEDRQRKAEEREAARAARAEAGTEEPIEGTTTTQEALKEAAATRQQAEEEAAQITNDQQARLAEEQEKLEQDQAARTDEHRALDAQANPHPRRHPHPRTVRPRLTRKHSLRARRRSGKTPKSSPRQSSRLRSRPRGRPKRLGSKKRPRGCRSTRRITRPTRWPRHASGPLISARRNFRVTSRQLKRNERRPRTWEPIERSSGGSAKKHSKPLEHRLRQRRRLPGRPH